MDNLFLDGMTRLINNFEHDMKRSGMFEGTVDFFISDLRGLIDEMEIRFDKEYERGKDDGYKEAEDELGYDESVLDDLNRARDLVDDAISRLERW